MTSSNDSERPPMCYDERAVRLPNGCWLEPGGRVRVPKEHIWLPEVRDAAERLGWVLENGSASPGSEVLAWPADPLSEDQRSA